ncbi:HAD hydrolase-like protein [Glaciecola siphonariae]|uniref:HAD hydrolase-like protein n=1 Tax=Glaciecola siphonariae TaxID=521012 RepID=A0ABV9LUV2_9ALTE
MIGDNFKNDIAPAIEAGLHTIWFNGKDHKTRTGRCKQIQGLIELCT